MDLSYVDPIVIGVYLVGITAFGIWVGFRRNASSDHYFLANKSLGWFTVGAAVFTSNISTIHLVGLAAGGAKDGLVIGNFEWMACFTLMLLALIFAPFYLRTRVATLPEFMERRYCPQARTFLAFIGLIGALLIHIGISLFAAAKLFDSFLGVPPIYTIVVLSLFTVTYTALGGLKAVVMTENIQVCLLLAGATLVTVLGLRALPDVGVYDVDTFKAAVFRGQLNMLQPVMTEQKLQNDQPDAASASSPAAQSVVAEKNRQNENPAAAAASSQSAVGEPRHLNEYSWLAVLLGYPILGIWYWCADQTHVQRVLGARDLKAAQNGALFAGFLKITPVFLMVFPGVIGYVLWTKGVIQLPKLPETGETDYNKMLPSLINYLVPVGLKGLLAAGMAAALMSCMAAALNSCATLISMDIVKRWRPGLADTRVVTIGRITTGVIMVLAMLWSTQGDQFGTIFEAINKIPMTFAPAVTTVFVLGLLWKRGTKQAAMTTLYIGSIIGILYFVLDLPSIGKAILGPDNVHAKFGGLVSDTKQGLGIPFMLVGPILAAGCTALYIATSLLTPAMDPEEVSKVCWDHPLAFLQGRLSGASDPRIVTLILAAVVGTLYYFLR